MISFKRRFSTVDTRSIIIRRMVFADGIEYNGFRSVVRVCQAGCSLLRKESHNDIITLTTASRNIAWVKGGVDA